MNATEMGVLKQVAVTTLVSHSHHLSDIGEAVRFRDPYDSSLAEARELERLEELGLIAFGAHGRSLGDVKLTSAGVEILAYLAAAG
ncbi:hypothetical protein [Rhodococcus rhodochrous]|uniref:Uncharacterized protein n=1 Tax=Rhodococcus rhodochrous KG-21 TaxID=1441923 RepID=A0A0M8PQ95_RHORH|nr:hypothetical protein [Rhodococcus rhodochrous]KOS56348.1 hypothetical protein Z051_10355 [Rhodococcus rhodochrous KG-21]